MSNEVIQDVFDLEAAIIKIVKDLGAADREAYAVPINELLTTIRGREVTPGQLYTSLQRLEQKGLLEAWLSEPSAYRGGRRKRLYRVTDSGELAYRKWERQAIGVMQLREALL